MRLPHQRFTTRWLMVAVAIVGLVVVVVSRMFDAFWVGHESVPLEFLILDASTGHPINRVSIRLIDGPPEYEATTGPDGKAGIVIHAMTAGKISLQRRTRSVNYGFWRLAISAEGYKRMKDDLEQYTWDTRFHSDTIPPAIVIRLQRETSIP